MKGQVILGGAELSVCELVLIKMEARLPKTIPAIDSLLPMNLGALPPQYRPFGLTDRTLSKAGQNTTPEFECPVSLQLTRNRF